MDSSFTCPPARSLIWQTLHVLPAWPYAGQGDTETGGTERAVEEPRIHLE